MDMRKAETNPLTGVAVPHDRGRPESAQVGFDRPDICYCGGCAHTRVPSCPPKLADSAGEKP